MIALRLGGPPNRLHNSLLSLQVTTRSNGDLLVACDDGCARVFSADQGRYASDDAIATFTEHVSQIALSKAGEADGKIGDLDTSNLVGPERLTTPGDSDGQIIMVKDGAKVRRDIVNQLLNCNSQPSARR